MFKSNNKASQILHVLHGPQNYLNTIQLRINMLPFSTLQLESYSLV